MARALHVAITRDKNFFANGDISAAVDDGADANASVWPNSKLGSVGSDEADIMIQAAAGLDRRGSAIVG